MSINIIDLFAGPGGLSEGFCSFQNGERFKIAVSAEMDPFAYATLCLRSFYRFAKLSGDKTLQQSYINYCSSENSLHPSLVFPKVWKDIKKDSLCVELGTADGNKLLDKTIKNKKLHSNETILIGGPPCQAYSSVGRSRNMGIVGYVAEEDNRHFLYRQYLRIISRFRPAVFVLENVQGILSSTIKGELIFRQILKDLSCPVRKQNGIKDLGYSIFSAVSPVRFNIGDNPEEIDARDFIVKAEEYGIPQARHRVILIGIRNDLNTNGVIQMQKSKSVSIDEVLEELPRLRSGISSMDSPERWESVITQGVKEIIIDAKKKKQYDLIESLNSSLKSLDKELPKGALRMEKLRKSTLSKRIKDYYGDGIQLPVWINHEAKSHMPTDLVRYFYAAVFAQVRGVSPKAPDDFLLANLAPNHKNWNTGYFSDRFRVQIKGQPSTTVTSHLAKDGHYFIHYDPLQCRSLTVREAARLQTFPDNYFFQGNKTEQYRQVGNAVPPQLAVQIARIVSNILEYN